MAIEKRFIHFKKFSDFNSKKLSANEANTQYTVGISGEIQTGSPDVLYQSYVWIKDTQQQWTHGQIYNGGDVDIDTSKYISWDDVDAEISETSTNPIQSKAVNGALEEMSNAFGQFLSEKQDTISDLDTIRSGASKGATALQPDAISEFITIEDVANVAKTGSYNDLQDKPTIPSAVTESTVSGWGFTKNAGTITGVSANGTSVATSGVANIPAASTSKYGVTKLSSATNSTSTSLAATASAVKAAYDLANGRQEKLVSGTNIKTINNTSILGSGNIAIDANIQAVDSSESLDDVVTNTKEIVEVTTASLNFNPLLPNKIYVVTTPVTSIGINDITPPTGLTGEYLIHFTTKEESTFAPSLICINTVKWANGTIPSMQLNTTYELSIAASKLNDEYVYKAVLVPFQSV